MCAHTFCMWLHCFDMLSCPDLRMKTASSSSWGGSPTSFLTQNTCSSGQEDTHVLRVQIGYQPQSINQSVCLIY